MKQFDKIIIGAGLYGLYSALYCVKKGQQIVVLEKDSAPFMRATYINQARVHMGYHYPRSLSTAIKSAGYFKRFVNDYGFCINSKFDQVYATAAAFSWTDAKEFVKFCSDSKIRCDEVACSKYFNEGVCDGAFLTEEFTYDAQVLKEFLLEELGKYRNCTIYYNCNIQEIIQDEETYVVKTNEKEFISTYVLNATYASVNQILKLVKFNTFKIKYELCEIILCDVNEKLKDTGITVMDGPFFSIMPFGQTGKHSLTSVTFTPHSTSYDECPTFECQIGNEDYCCPSSLGNCNFCKNKPESAWSYMSNLARKYLKSDYQFKYVESLFSMKPILKASEIDDSRPTVIKVFSEKPYFISVLSGKINTVYDLEEVLNLGD